MATFFGNIQKRSFSPKDISDLTLWLDSSDLNTITKDMSDKVSVWSDKSDSGFTIRQTTGSNQPTWQSSGFNGKNTINFSGNPQRMIFDASQYPISNLTDHTVIVVGNTNNSGTQNWVSNWNSPAVSMFWGVVSGNYRFGDNWNNTGANATTSDQIIIWTSLASDATIHHGTSLQGSKGSNITSPNSINLNQRYYLGVQGTFGSEFLVGDISEILIYDHALPEGERSQLVNYLNKKWVL
jgi:hypothetical protein